MKYRLLEIAVGYFVAVFVAAVLASILVAWNGARSMGESPDFTQIELIAWLKMIAAIFSGILLVFIIPSSLLIAIFEWRGWRRLPPYPVIGCLFALPVALDYEPDRVTTFWSCLIGATACLIYWLVTGRKAGQWSNVTGNERQES